MESTAIFAVLLPRLEHIGLAGSPNAVASTFVSGLRSLPVRAIGSARPDGSDVASGPVAAVHPPRLSTVGYSP
jgi:hypothetical protein